MSTATAIEHDEASARTPPFEPGSEFVDGVWMERTMGNEVAEIANELRYEMVANNRRNRLGRVVGPDSGFQYAGLAGGQRRHPDAAFIRNDQVAGGKLARSWDAFAPALVAEVVSPHDTAGEAGRKIREWMNGGVELVWVIPVAPPRTRKGALGISASAPSLPSFER